MAENEMNATPMTGGDRGGDIGTPPTGTQFQPAAPLKDAGVEFNAEGGTLAGSGGSDTAGAQQGGGAASDAKQALRDGASNVSQQVADKARTLVEDGKARATGALDQLVQLLNDAAGTVDEKLGGQYGDYARNAATSVQGFAETIRNKDADALMDDARGYIRQSPTAAIGIAAALGFAAARLVQSSLDSSRA